VLARGTCFFPSVEAPDLSQGSGAFQAQRYARMQKYFGFSRGLSRRWELQLTLSHEGLPRRVRFRIGLQLVLRQRRASEESRKEPKIRATHINRSTPSGILPANKRLLDPSLDKDSQLAAQLLQRWATLHAVRSALSLASFLVFLFATIWP
jgi:Domain of unknown function (DUF1772)